MINPIADRVHLSIRPKSGERLSPEHLANVARTAHGEVVQVSADGGARLAFPADRYSVQQARGNLEMAARMELGARWHTRYEIADP